MKATGIRREAEQDRVLARTTREALNDRQNREAVTAEEFKKRLER